MIEYSKVKIGDKLRIVGAGAPGFAKLGDVVTVTKTAERRVDVVREDGETAYFALTCGAERLEPIEKKPESEFFKYFLSVIEQIASKEAGEGDLINCPKCGGKIRFSVAPNGHTRGACITTENCFRWIQ
jgi:hypothetical protein